MVRRSSIVSSSAIFGNKTLLRLSIVGESISQLFLFEKKQPFSAVRICFLKFAHALIHTYCARQLFVSLKTCHRQKLLMYASAVTNFGGTSEKKKRREKKERSKTSSRFFSSTFMLHEYGMTLSTVQIDDIASRYSTISIVAGFSFSLVFPLFLCHSFLIFQLRYISRRHFFSSHFFIISLFFRWNIWTTNTLLVIMTSIDQFQLFFSFSFSRLNKNVKVFCTNWTATKWKKKIPFCNSSICFEYL